MENGDIQKCVISRRVKIQYMQRCPQREKICTTWNGWKPWKTNREDMLTIIIRMRCDNKLEPQQATTRDKKHTK